MHYNRIHTVVEAMQYSGPPMVQHILDFCGHWASSSDYGLWITTPGGGKRLEPGWWVVKEGPGRFPAYPPGEFQTTFTKADQ